MKTVYARPKLLKEAHFHYCPGCGHGIINRLLMEVMEEMDLQSRAVCVAPAGCGMLLYNYFEIDVLESAHGRGAAVATGIKRARPDTVVFSYQGDGDLAAIGTAEGFHAANRGENITVIFVNNGVYGMTGGQMAPTTLLDQVTTTTPGRTGLRHRRPSGAHLRGVRRTRRHRLPGAGGRQQAGRGAEDEEGHHQGLPVPARRRGLLSRRDPLALSHQLEDGHGCLLHVDRRRHGQAVPARGDQGHDMLVGTIFSGFGGQGVLSMGSTLAKAAMLEGKHVTYLPTYGVEVRGGTANCTVVVSDEEIASPVASEPEYLVAMNQPSFARFQSILQAGGLLCVNSSLVNTDSARTDIEILAIPTSELAEQVGTIKVANMILLGALLRASNMISYDAMLENLEAILGEGKAKLIELNRQALDLGYNYVKE